MADKPILFSAPMVRALLAGTKTQTRRTMNPQPVINSAGLLIWERKGWWCQGKPSDVAVAQRIHVGDRLWVRETWAPLTALTHNDPGTQAIIDGGFYRADEGTVDGEVSKWKPSIFMTRHASRLTLIVTDVRVERLQDISEADAVAEGADVAEGHRSQITGGPMVKIGPGTYMSPIAWYHRLWNSINGEGAWQANPWVVAYTFTVHHGNIDQIAQVVA